MSLSGRGKSGKHKPDFDKMAGDLRAHTNAIGDLQRQINLLGARLEKVEVVKAGPQDSDVKVYKSEPDPQEPQPPETE